MKMTVPGFLGLAFLLAEWLSPATPAYGSFTKIAHTSDGFTSFFGSPSINDDGTVAFVASRVPGDGGGVFRGSGGPILTIDEGRIGYAGGSAIINSAGKVVFFSYASPSSFAIVTGDGASSTVVATGLDLYRRT